MEASTVSSTLGIWVCATGFEVEPDVAYLGRKWDELEVTKQIKAFESRRSYRRVKTLHRRSADPRVLSLQELLRAMR